MIDNKKNKYIFIIVILLVLIILVTLYIFVTNSEDNQSLENTNKDFILDEPGPTNIECTSNIDCDDICKNDGCLISSCVKNQNQEGGKCVCLDICGI